MPGSLPLPPQDQRSAEPQDPWSRWGFTQLVAFELRRDQLLAGMPPISEEQLPDVMEAFLHHQGLDSQAAVQAWMQANHLDAADLQARAHRQAVWLQVCERRWAGKLPSYFLKRKPQLDQVSYTALSVAEEALALELHQRLKEEECSFDDLFQAGHGQESLGPCGHLGPVPLAELPDGLAELLRVSRPGQLWPPKPLQQGWLLVQLDVSKPAVLDPGLRRRLLLELGDEWLMSMPVESNIRSASEAEP